MADVPFVEVWTGSVAADSARVFVGVPFFESDGGGNIPTPPVVTLISPAEGAIEPDSVIVIEVTDAQDFSALLLAMRCGAAGIYEVIHDGSSFAPAYTAAPNSFQVIANGWRYSLRRLGGWPPGVSFSTKVFAVDTKGSAA